MSILIKGMEMPTRCGRCDMCVSEADGDIDWHNVCCITGADIVDVGEKMVDCPLVPVPPHGDLIDESVLLKGCGYIIADGMACIPVKYIANAPAIIPAELPVHHGTFAAASGQEALKRIALAEEGET